jgi:hypothetical protein
MNKNEFENFDVPTSSETTESAKNWDYLGSIHNIYMLMMEKFYHYQIAQGIGNSSVKFWEYKSSISTLHFMVLFQFNKYLESESNTKPHLTPQLYAKIMENNQVNQVKELMEHLIYWLQAYGFFRLETEKNNPEEWFAK